MRERVAGASSLVCIGLKTMDIALNLRKTSIILSDFSQGGLKRNVAMTFRVEKSICDAPLKRLKQL